MPKQTPKMADVNLLSLSLSLHSLFEFAFSKGGNPRNSQYPSGSAK